MEPETFGGIIRRERQEIGWSESVAAQELETLLRQSDGQARVTRKRWRWLESRDHLPDRSIFLAICELYDWPPAAVLQRLGWIREGDEWHDESGNGHRPFEILL